MDSERQGLEMPATTVYWRPGCMFCRGLFRELERAGLDVERVNIWDDPEAAAFVRSVADGNETVPTVAVGDHALVNPTGHDVLELVAEQAPDDLPPHWVPGEPGILAEAVNRLTGRGDQPRPQPWMPG